LGAGGEECPDDSGVFDPGSGDERSETRHVLCGVVAHRGLGQRERDIRVGTCLQKQSNALRPLADHGQQQRCRPGQKYFGRLAERRFVDDGSMRAGLRPSNGYGVVDVGTVVDQLPNDVVVAQVECQHEGRGTRQLATRTTMNGRLGQW